MTRNQSRAIGWTACAAALALLVGALIGGTAASSAPAAVALVRDAWIRLPAVAGRPAAGYFTIVAGPQRDRLQSVTSPAAARIEMHSMTMTSSSVMSMNPLPAVTLRPGEKVSFAPGGNHLMLFDLDPALKSGVKVPLTFHLASGGTVTATARAVEAGAAAAKVGPPMTMEHGAH